MQHRSNQKQTRDCMIQIPLTPEEFNAKAALLSRRQGIDVRGTEGIIEKMGVKASYLYRDGLLNITLIQKPAFLSEEICEKQLRAWL